ncbi:MAG: AAA family ATPase [Archangium sp.]|nr:AAA family ATPase [Archangium sp.]
MIVQVHINGVRGLRNATVGSLSPISVLVGRNGCGKSTVLDVLSVAASENPTFAASVSFARRSAEDGVSASKWFVHSAMDRATIKLRASEGSRDLVFARKNDDLLVQLGSHAIGHLTGQLAVNHTDIGSLTPKLVTDLRFVDMRARSQTRRPAHDLYSEARTAGRKAVVVDLIRGLLPDVEDLEILTVDNRPVLHLSYQDRAVPLSLSGDGVRNIALLSFELGVRPNSLILVEEPETHLHPAAMISAAEAMVRTVRPQSKSENQLVLATHSLEFIDALVRSAQKLGALDLLSVHRLSLENGELKVSSLTGDLVLDARADAELELR